MRPQHCERRRMLFVIWLLWLVMMKLHMVVSSGLMKRLGKTSDYCGTGCQISFGSPGESSTFECGPTHGNQICDSGLCCSQYG